MNAGVMEGLIGASVNRKMLDVPMRVYHEGERTGNTAVMERAMGYAADFTERANAYKDKAEEEWKREMAERREVEKQEREEAIEKAREEGKTNQEPLTGEITDCVEISEEGRILLEQSKGDMTGAQPETVELSADNGQNVSAML